MRSLYRGESKYRGTCIPARGDYANEANVCSNQFYWLTISRIKLGKPAYTRKVFSIGFIFRGYGRIIDIPLTRWSPIDQT